MEEFKTRKQKSRATMMMEEIQDLFCDGDWKSPAEYNCPLWAHKMQQQQGEDQFNKAWQEVGFNGRK